MAERKCTASVSRFKYGRVGSSLIDLGSGLPGCWEMTDSAAVADAGPEQQGEDPLSPLRSLGGSVRFVLIAVEGAISPRSGKLYRRRCVRARTGVASLGSISLSSLFSHPSQRLRHKAKAKQGRLRPLAVMPRGQRLEEPGLAPICFSFHAARGISICRGGAEAARGSSAARSSNVGATGLWSRGKQARHPHFTLRLPDRLPAAHRLGPVSTRVRWGYPGDS